MRRPLARPHRPVIVGIAGPSCSGKSTIARIVAERLGATLMHLDRYWIKGARRPVVSGHPSFERPDQYDGAALMRDAIAASRGGDVVVEGFLLFTYPGAAEACDASFVIDADHEELVQRRLGRGGESVDDVEGGRVPEADAGWHAHGKEEWIRFGEPQKLIPGVAVIDATSAESTPGHLALGILTAIGKLPNEDEPSAHVEEGGCAA